MTRACLLAGLLAASLLILLLAEVSAPTPQAAPTAAGMAYWATAGATAPTPRPSLAPAAAPTLMATQRTVPTPTILPVTATVMAMQRTVPTPTTSLVTPGPRQADLDPLWDPDTAIVRAMQDAGIPTGPAPMPKAIRAHASDTVYTAVLRDPKVLADSQAFRVALRDLVLAGSKGEKIFGGWSVEQLRVLAQRARAADRTRDPGGAALALRLQDDATSEALYETGRYAGLIQLARDAMRKQAHDACIKYRYTVQYQRPGVHANCFEYLVDPAR